MDGAGEDKCHGKTKAGKACGFKGRYEKDGACYCKTHLPIEECSVCYEHITQRNGITLPCKHTFHTKCVKKWIVGNHTTCPYCRAPIGDDVMDRLCPIAEDTTRTFVLDFASNLSEQHLQDIHRLVMSVVNAHVLGIIAANTLRVADTERP